LSRDVKLLLFKTFYTGFYDIALEIITVLILLIATKDHLI